MIAASALIAKCQQALSEGWGYILGQSGAVWTQIKQDAATDEMTIRYGSRWIGKRVADCSGLFYWAFKELGGSIYHGSNTIWKQYCTAQGTLRAGQELRPGTALFKVNGDDRYHIGLYIGEDTVIEARGTQYGVVTSSVSTWHEWGELKGVDYSEAVPLAPSQQGKTVTIVSQGGKVNIRRGNGTNFPCITSVKPGTVYNLVATAANGWNAVVIGSQVGWVSGDYSTIA